MRTNLLILFIILLLGGGAVFFLKDKAPNLAPHSNTPSAPTPDPATYAVIKEEINYHRSKLAKQYLHARTEQQRKAVLKNTRDFLELTMPALMKCWLGTPWDFNGMATEPGKGKVACGYFVSTIMQDSGFNIQRIKLAQQPSQNILLTFLHQDQLQVKVGKDYHQYMRDLRAGEHGIYIIGLDKHVGFLINNPQGLFFIHSGGKYHRVNQEDEAEAASIRRSKYRVVGNLTSSDTLIKKWLMSETFATHL